MQRETKRRAVLGGLVVAGVGTAGYLTSVDTDERPVRFLGPKHSLAESAEFASVRGFASGDVLDVWVAMREKAYERRQIELFADTDSPATSSIPGLRGDWRFDADISGMDPGTYTLAIGDRSLEVTLQRTVPDRFENTRLELRPRGLWRTAFADAYAYDTGPETGRLVVEFRERTPPLSTDSLVYRSPDGTVVGRRDTPDGVYRVPVELDPFERHDGRGTLRRLRDGLLVDELELVAR